MNYIYSHNSVLKVKNCSNDLNNIQRTPKILKIIKTKLTKLQKNHNYQVMLHEHKITLPDIMTTSHHDLNTVSIQ